MRSVMFLVRNNIRHKTGAFKGIIILMTIIVFAYSGSVSNSKNLDRALNASLDHYKVGDIVMTYAEGKLSDRIKDGLDSSEHVSSWRADPLLFVAMDHYLNGKPQTIETRLVREKDEIKLFNDDQTGFVDKAPKLEAGEVYVSYSLGKVEKLEKGDILEIQTSPTTKEKFTIKGFTEEPLYGTSLVAYEIFFISPEDYDRIADGIDRGEVNSNYIYKTEMLHIFSDGELGSFQLVKQLNDQCGLVDESMLYVTRAELESYTELYADTGTSLLYIFVGLLAVVVVLMMLNSINSTIEMQYVDLGILKSQGFTVWQIRAAYMMQYIIALLIGTVLGLILSVPLLKVLGNMFRTVTGIHTDCSIDFLSCGLIALAMIAVFTVIILLSTRKLGRLSPVNALNNAHRDVHFTGRLNAPMKQNALSLSVSVRQLTSGMRHYIFIFVITVILMFFMTTVFNLCRGLNFREIFGELDTAANVRLFNEFSDEDKSRVAEKLKALDESPEVYYVSYIDNILADDILFGVTATDGCEKYFKPIEGKLPEFDNEMIVTRIFSEETGKGIGDSVTVSNEGKKAEYIIVGTYQTTSQAGRIFTMTLEGGKKIGMKPQLANLFLSDNGKSEDVCRALNEEFGGILYAKPDETEESNGNLYDLIDAFLLIIILVVVGVSSVFLLVAISMICRITFLRERTDIGIFKATGFTTGNLRGMFSLRFLIIGVLGCTVGLVLSLLFTNSLLSQLMRITGMTDFSEPMTAFDILLPAGLICACFAGFSYMVSAMIKNVQTTELICE
ncbi:MAG: FtsX-like permease family protein [Ruminococcus sp.]|nr:FtsX-like permease family protein [Ruminococcus sp.]